MEVDFSYYMDHYFDPTPFWTFFGLAFGTLFVMFVIMYLYTQITVRGKGKERKEKVRIEWHILLERFYEMIFSGTSILFFIAIYYLINRFFTIEPYRAVWDKYKDFFLMILIILSCFYNSFLDRVFVRFKFLTREERGSGRLTGMVYMLIIFAYIKFIYENDNYDMFITYFLGLMVGRFAYFDSNIHDFVKAMDGVRKNLILMLGVIVYTSVMCYYGFTSEYLLIHNGVITNVFITHLFMCAAIFILYHLHIAELISGRGTRKPRIELEDESEEYSNEYYGDDADYYEGAEDLEDEEYDGQDYEDDDYYDEEYIDQRPSGKYGGLQIIDLTEDEE